MHTPKSSLAHGLTASLTALALLGCSGPPAEDDETSQEAETASTIIATASLLDRSGEEIGMVTISDSAGSAVLSVEATALSGEHGFHIHQTGDCTAADFTSAAGHLNPMEKEHGAENPAGKHLGDLPNLSAGADGTATTEITLEYAPDELKAWIFDDDGAAIVVHEGPDDYRSDPAGDAGPRIACGQLNPA